MDAKNALATMYGMALTTSNNDSTLDYLDKLFKCIRDAIEEKKNG
jgi:hypothetical protein